MSSTGVGPYVKQIKVVSVPKVMKTFVGSCFLLLENPNAEVQRNTSLWVFVFNFALSAGQEYRNLRMKTKTFSHSLVLMKL